MNPSSRFQVAVGRVMGGALAVAWAAGMGLTPVRAQVRVNLTAFDSRRLNAEGSAWAEARATDGTLVVGTNQLLFEEGKAWRALAVPGAYAFRGLKAVENGRIYAGAIGDLGYAERDAAGTWEWTSLKGALEQAHAETPFEVWGVKATPQGVVFVLKHQVARWDGKGFQVWNLPCEPRLIAVGGDDDPWVYQAGVGLLKMGDNGPEVLLRDEDLPSKPVAWALKDPASAGTDLLVGTNEGVFRRLGTRWSKVEPFSSAVAYQLPTCAAWIPASGRGETELAVGTFLGGVFVAHPDGTRVTTINRGSGLADNSVYSMASEASDQLWIGLNRGFEEVQGLGVATVFGERDGLTGPVNGVVQVGNQDVLSTDHDLLTLNPGAGAGPLARLAAPEAPNTFIWTSAALGDDLFVGGFGGVWRYTVKTSTWHRDFMASADVTTLTPSKRRPGWIYFTNGTSLMALEARSAVDAAQGETASKNIVAAARPAWIPRDLGQHLDDAPISALEDHEGALWVSTHKGEVFRFVLVDAPGGPPKLARTQTLFPGGALPPDAGRIALASVGGRVFLLTEKGALASDAALSRLSPVENGSAWRVVAAGAEQPNGSAFWLVRNAPDGPPALYQVRWSPDGSRLDREPKVAPGIEKIGSPAAVFSTVDNGGSETWISGSEGLLRLEDSQLSAPPPPPGIALHSVVTNGDQHQPFLRQGHASPTLRLDPDIRTIAFGYAPARSDEGLRYQTRLAPVEDNWSGGQAAQEREYEGLRPGNYVFAVRTLDLWGRAGPEGRLAFAIEAPWWATGWARTGYVAIVVLAMMGLYRWRIARLRQQNERLNRLVEERTQELAQANSAKADFLENISHEIRNPLNGVVGLVGLLREIPLDAKARSLAGSLAACARTLSRVFEEVLSFSKLEYGQVKVKVRAFSPVVLLEDVMSVFCATAVQRGTAWVVRWEGTPPPALLGDDEKIRTIVANFVNNAFKYAPDSPVEILAQAEVTVERQVELTINVRDRGPGIGPDEQAKIFRKFVRGAEARKHDVPGTGLGLAACKALAELMGGFVGVESEVGKGTTFYLRLRLPAADPAEIPAPEVLEVTSLPRVAEPGERLLVVEDEDYNRIVSVRIAERLGFAPDVAADAEGATERMFQGAYAVILVDWELSGAKGSDVAVKARTFEGTKEAVIIATTAHDSDHVRRECREAGMDGFALKPLDAGQIAQIILEVRARRKGREVDESEGEPLDARVFALVGENRAEETQAAAMRWLGTLDQHLASLRKAIAEEQPKEAAAAAHRLRSHGGLIGAQTLSQAAGALQGALDNGDPGDPLFPTLLGAVETAAAKAKGRVEDWIGRQDANRQDPGVGI